MLIAASMSNNRTRSINAAISPHSFTDLRPVSWGTRFLSAAERLQAICTFICRKPNYHMLPGANVT